MKAFFLSSISAFPVTYPLCLFFSPSLSLQEGMYHTLTAKVDFLSPRCDFAEIWFKNLRCISTLYGDFKCQEGNFQSSFMTPLCLKHNFTLSLQIKPLNRAQSRPQEVLWLAQLSTIHLTVTVEDIMLKTSRPCSYRQHQIAVLLLEFSLVICNTALT